ncbi:DUF3710 domain-containing protein [Williamsia sterculiae]|uniref:DUF3710 domain-containing protein n=1 Tax=Williamsia sterculiae TaxID=1344003 RepID=A0A1N7EF24_9NOCA|nr:DUF3710 domain-containing protein [Williamsia sterculiae]SIR86763.1 Protein of unknown function [Williamsia sterculiae]
MARRDRPTDSDEQTPQPAIGQGLGPYDIGDLGAEPDLENSHLDLGSVLVPVVEGGQVTVEMSAEHQPQAVHLVTPHGRITVAAFAAPKSPGLWREVMKELTESLRGEGAQAAYENGHWGREIVATVPGAVHRFIGVDGPRWMVRLVASAPPESADALTPVARAVLSESVVRRGTDPLPPREPLPVVLPPVLAEQVAAAQQQLLAEQAGDEGAGFDVSATETPVVETAAVAPGSDEPVADPPPGARFQSAQATVFSEDDETQPVVQDTPDDAVTPPDDPASGSESAEPSEGSALQQLRRRRWRRG